MSDAFRGKRVTVMGLGTRGGGLGVARYLAEAGAVVTVTDMRSEADLVEPIMELAGLPIRFALGGHNEREFTLEGADIVVRNPGVRRNSPYLKLARASGVGIEMEMSIFLRACPAPVIGLTGTKGKTTTATLCAEMLRHWDPRTVLAGNMGVSAVAELSRITSDTPVVVELSSWQLEALEEHRLSPAVAVLTNISEDHLDAYDGFSDYAETKRSIARHQRPGDAFVVNADDLEATQDLHSLNGRVIPFGLGDRAEPGMWVEGTSLIWRLEDNLIELPIPERLPFLGIHQRMNAAAASAAALVRGAPWEAVVAGLASFGGVRNRMEVIAEVDGVTFINDSAATAPVAAIANLKGLDGRRVHLIAGGHDKQADLVELAGTIAERAQSIHLLEGTATHGLRALIQAHGRDGIEIYRSMADAVRAAADSAAAGEIVLLSPGCASFGLFRDEFDRGDQFRAAVAALHAARVSI
jgi:UDP-N-acetylmuramoylalanine--D-glutamate ligase